jgi:hypothetical protein
MERAVKVLGEQFLKEDGADDFEAQDAWFASDPMGQEIMYIAGKLDIDDVHAWNIGFRADGSWAFLDYAS